MNTKSWIYNIDIVGSCNLKCPSCPIGNYRNSPHAKGVMPLDIFEKILIKIKDETPNIAYLQVYNWAEPMLHPRLPELIYIARKHGIPLSLSTNLNINHNLEEIVTAYPLSVRISVSGFSQNIYERTHTNGNIEKVKANMKLLRQLINQHKSQMEVHVAYHCYVDNIGAEYENMKRFCHELGFSFLPFFAYLLPLEKLISYFEKGPQMTDKEILNLMAVKPEEIRSFSLPYRFKDCELRSNRTAINCDGSVALCCGVYDDSHNIARYFLNTSHDELQRRKYINKFCLTCMKYGLHSASLYYGSHKWISVAEKRIQAPKLPKELIRTHYFMHMRQLLCNAIGISLTDKIIYTFRKILWGYALDS